MKCEASGFPAPVISYYFNATRITTGVSDDGLTLTSVTAANNAGPYQCFADNVRADSSALWVITVRDPCECYVYIPTLVLCIYSMGTRALHTY